MQDRIVGFTIAEKLSNQSANLIWHILGCSVMSSNYYRDFALCNAPPRADNLSQMRNIVFYLHGEKVCPFANF